VQFKGPYVISEDLGKGRFRVQDDKGHVLKKTVSCHRLKLWLEPNKRPDDHSAVSVYNTALSISSVVCLTWFAQQVKLHDKCKSEKVDRKTQQDGKEKRKADGDITRPPVKKSRCTVVIEVSRTLGTLVLIAH
jgi:hypothetical protein